MTTTSTPNGRAVLHRVLRLTALSTVSFVAGMYTQAWLTSSTQDSPTAPSPSVVRSTEKQTAWMSGPVTRVELYRLYVKDRNGKEVEVTLDSKATVQLSVPGSLKDIKTGDNVIVRGQRTSDNSMLASTLSEDHPR